MEKSRTRSGSGMMPSSVSESKFAQLRTCSSDRKRCMVLQAYAISSYHFQKGTATYPAISSGSATKTSPSLISTWIGKPQSRQGKSIRTVLPGKSQQTASDSNPHCPNHFCWPSMVIRYWVGRLLKGANDVIRSVLGYSHPGIISEKRS